MTDEPNQTINDRRSSPSPPRSETYPLESDGAEIVRRFAEVPDELLMLLRQLDRDHAA
jgi:hypothetical protein